MAQYDYWPRFGLENYSFKFSVEELFNVVESTKWMQKYWALSFLISAVYVILIYFGQKFMESRKAFLLNNALFCWNMGLAIFSFMGMIRMAPEMFWSINSNSLVYSICTTSYAQGVTGYWSEKFAMSKVFELIDTAFIILRKKPLIFLHWYHHVTVLVYTWHAYKDHTASGRWFIIMNYTVHAFMYTYYALRTLQIAIPKLAAMTITVMQIAQMIIGVVIGVSIYFIKQNGGMCQQTWSNLYFSFFIYFTYFLLFCHFFYNAYLKQNYRYNVTEKSKNKKSLVKCNDDNFLINDQKNKNEAENKFMQNLILKNSLKNENENNQINDILKKESKIPLNRKTIYSYRRTSPCVTRSQQRLN